MAKGRALILCGGWEGHSPEDHARWAEGLLHEYKVDRSADLSILNPDSLQGYDLLLPIWTFGEITIDQERALLGAVNDGLGMVAWHGATSAFLSSRPHKHLLGGQFVCHPGGDSVRYQVSFNQEHPIGAGLSPIQVVSEQYYFLIDPAVRVIATTRMIGAEMPWLADIEMPTAWTRSWGLGRVFYCALGHTTEDLASQQVRTIFKRAISWASRSHMPGSAVVTPAALPIS